MIYINVIYFIVIEYIYYIKGLCFYWLSTYIAPVIRSIFCMIQERESLSILIMGGFLFGSSFDAWSAIAVIIPAESVDARPLTGNHC